jgi:uncharacterized protein YcbK (DUF882 family)
MRSIVSIVAPSNAHMTRHVQATRGAFAALLGVIVGLAVYLAPIRADAREVTHKVQKGQYLNLIARRYHTTAAAIMRRNKMRAIDLKPGMTLVIVETNDHRAWRQTVERKTGRKVKEKVLRPKAEAAPKKAAPKKAAPKKAAPKKAAPKKAAPKKAAPKKAAPKKAAPKNAPPPTPATPRVIENAKKRVAPRGTTPASERPAIASPVVEAAVVAPEVTKPAATKSFARKPKRPGHVTLVRYREKFRGPLIASNGKLIAKSSKRVDRLLRSLRSGKQTKIDRRLLSLLAEVSDHFGGRTIEVVSGFRPYSPKQYTRNSRHNHGKAVDFRVVGVPTDVLFDFCRNLEHVGCGYYPNSGFVHMDVRKRKTQWTDYSGPGQPPKYAHRQRKNGRRAKASTVARR